MKRTRIIAVLVATTLILTLALAACSSSLKDGTYKAESADFASSGWKDTVSVTISGGKISAVDWSGVSNNPDITVDKKTYAKNGEYGMLAAGASAEWDEQAAAAEKFIVNNNGTDKIKLGEDGKTDAISGCTIHVDALVALVDDCLKQAGK